MFYVFLHLYIYIYVIMEKVRHIALNDELVTKIKIHASARGVSIKAYTEKVLVDALEKENSSLFSSPQVNSITGEKSLKEILIH